MTKPEKWLKINHAVPIGIVCGYPKTAAEHRLKTMTGKRNSKQTIHYREKAIWCKAFMSLEAEPALESCSELQRSFRR